MPGICKTTRVGYRHTRIWFIVQRAVSTQGAGKYYRESHPTIVQFNPQLIAMTHTFFSAAAPISFGTCRIPFCKLIIIASAFRFIWFSIIMSLITSSMVEFQNLSRASKCAIILGCTGAFERRRCSRWWICRFRILLKSSFRIRSRLSKLWSEQGWARYKSGTFLAGIVRGSRQRLYLK